MPITTEADEIKKAYGNDSKISEEKIAWIKQKWNKIKFDNTKSRLIALLKTNLLPIHIAIMVDNLEYFKLNYEKHDWLKLDTVLTQACLCGSKNITDFILDKLKLDYLTPQNNFILAYVSASNNIEWAKEIATLYARANISLPKDMFGVGIDFKTIEVISKIFNENSMSKTINNLPFK